MNLFDILYATATVALLVGAWYAMWIIFLSKVPVLAHLKAVMLGEKALPPRGKKHGVVFRAPTGPDSDSAADAAGLGRN